MGKKRHIFVSLFLLALFGAFQVSMSVFTHVHIVNGVTIVHSHPSSGKDHTHTPSQVITIAHICSFHSLEPEAGIILAAHAPVLYVLEHNANTFHAVAPYTQGIRLRAPPSSYIVFPFAFA